MTRIETGDWAGRELHAATVAVLNNILADSIDVRHRILSLRWACRRIPGNLVPSIVERLGWHIDRTIDAIADRIVLQGGVPLADVEQVAVNSRLPLRPLDAGAPPAVVDAARSLEVYSILLRAASDLALSLGDGSSAAMLAASSRELGLIFRQFEQPAPSSTT